MSIIIDLIILGILGICICFGYAKGLTKCIIKILSFIIAVVVAAILFKPVSNFVIENTKIDETITQSVINVVQKDVEETGEIKEDTNLPKPMVNYINDLIENTVEEAKNNVVGIAAQKISIVAINVGVAILLFIVIRIALVFVSALSKIVTDLPIIKQFDKLGGVIYGILKGLIIIFVILSLISLISPMIEQTGIIIAINKSVIGSILYNNNILLNLIF